MSRSSKFGVAVTVIWLTGAALLALSRRVDWAGMPLNAWGDFLAGVVAPLAFLWLVLGYFQQGEELRLNTKALLAQEAELRRQVEETAALVRNAERQAAAAEKLATDSAAATERAALLEERLAQPSFKGGGGSGAGGNLRVIVRNSGGNATDLSVMGPHGVNMLLEPLDVIRTGEVGYLQIKWDGSYPFKFTIAYRDKFQKTQSQTFEMYEPFKFQNVAVSVAGHDPNA